jgi:hypothetical protein
MPAPSFSARCKRTGIDAAGAKKNRFPGEELRPISPLLEQGAEKAKD